MAYTVKSFFETLKPYVIQDMQESGILASLTAAQAKIESGYGNSKLTVQCNNLFGIKGSYNGQSGRYLTTEYYNGVAQKVYANFRKYPSWQESIADHSSLFNRLARYKNLRGETDYIKACNNVQADGYATSPVYSTTLLTCINQYKLYEWDAEALNRPIHEDIVIADLCSGSGCIALAMEKYLRCREVYAVEKSEAA
ncbi:MAG: glucosaminidase domain-containing protein, partial [Lachnospiraceae bacterium]|nr:glucosaminidase domain-containing protein [Lachnospiraceae bacterium]